MKHSLHLAAHFLRPELLATPGLETPDAWRPKYASPGSAGFDFLSTMTVELWPGQTAIIPSGWAFAIPQGFFMMITHRSGLAIKHGIQITNAPGIIDSDYRGEVQLAMTNRSSIGGRPFTINVGDRIAQGLLCIYAQAALELVEELPPTLRGEGGLGSTGGFRIPPPTPDQIARRSQQVLAGAGAGFQPNPVPTRTVPEQVFVPVETERAERPVADACAADTSTE